MVQGRQAQEAVWDTASEEEGGEGKISNRFDYGS